MIALVVLAVVVVATGAVAARRGQRPVTTDRRWSVGALLDRRR